MSEKQSITVDNRIVRSCSKENSRYAINGALVKHVKGDKCVVAATNGRIASVTPGKVEGGKFEPFIVPASLIQKPSKAMKNSVLTLGGKDEKIESVPFNAKEQVSGPTIMEHPVEGTFPPIADVYASDGVAYAAITVNHELLKLALDSVADTGDYKPGVTLFVPVEGEKPDEVELKSGKKKVSTHDMTNKPLVIVGGGEKGGASVVMPLNTESTSAEMMNKGDKLFNGCK